MEKITLHTQPRDLVGKKVKNLRKKGILPARVYGKGLESENFSVTDADFRKAYHLSGHTGLVNLIVGDEATKPVLVRNIQVDPVRGEILHVDFYQVNLKVKVSAKVPVVLIGEEPESVHLGETIVLNPVSEIEVEALPADLIDKIEVDISKLVNIDDAITIGQLELDREKITLLADDDEVLVKLEAAVVAEVEEAIEATEETSEGGEESETSEESSEETGEEETTEE